jgi:hypothetical protein
MPVFDIGQKERENKFCFSNQIQRAIHGASQTAKAAKDDPVPKT